MQLFFNTGKNKQEPQNLRKIPKKFLRGGLYLNSNNINSSIKLQVSILEVSRKRSIDTTYSIIWGKHGSKITGKKENKNCPDIYNQDSFPEKRDFLEKFKLLYISIT